MLLLSKQLQRYEKLLENTNQESETTESVASAVTWYEQLEHARVAIDILLGKWRRGTVCPPGVVRAVMRELMEKTNHVIMDGCACTAAA